MRAPALIYSSAFELRDEEHLRARPDDLVVADVVDRAVDRHRGLLLEMLAKPGKAAIHLLDDAAQGLGLDLELGHAAGIGAAETVGQDHPRGHARGSIRPPRAGRHRAR